MDKIFYLPKSNRTVHILLHSSKLDIAAMLADAIDKQQHIMVIELRYNCEIKQATIICKVDHLFDESLFITQNNFVKH